MAKLSKTDKRLIYELIDSVLNCYDAEGNLEEEYGSNLFLHRKKLSKRQLRMLNYLFIEYF